MRIFISHRTSLTFVLMCALVFPYALPNFLAPAFGDTLPLADGGTTSPIPPPPTDSPTPDTTTSSPASVPSSPTPINLDLSSVNATLTGQNLLSGNQIVSIQQGGSALQITGASALTAAQYVALTQVLNNGQQSIQLNSLGTATGGSFTLSSQNITNLVIPQGVTAINNVATNGSLNLTGNLTNAGTFYAISTNPQVDVANISANNIFNMSGGLLTSVLPGGGLPGFSNAISNLSLSLTAIQNIVNAGSIISAANLNIVAGGSITNALPVGVTSATPLMQAFNNVNLFSNIGTFVNTGQITALTNNINMASQIAQNISISGIGGQFSALNGLVNVRDQSFIGNNDLSWTGSDVLAKQISLYSGSGSIVASLGNVVGTVETYAGAAHLKTSGDTLSLGNICITGDPTYYNTGNIQITGNVSVAETLAIIAGGNITSTAGLNLIRAQDGAGQGYSITLIAGANVNPPCGSCSSNAQAGSQAAGIVTIDPTTPTGGNIDFSGSGGGLLIDASSTTGNFSGGNISMTAFANGGIGGQIILPASTTLRTSGIGTGNNGNVTLIAGANSGTSITTGQIIASGGSGTTGGTGQISITTAQPTTSNAAAITFNTTGSIISGNTLAASATVLPTGVSINNNLSAANGITVSAGSITVTGGSTVTSTTVNLNASTLTSNGTISATTGDLAVQSKGAGNALTLNLGPGSTMNANSAGSNITFNATLPGSISAISGFGNLSAGNQVNFNGGTSPVNVSVNSINGDIAGSGNTISVAVAIGDLDIGPISTPGSLNFTATNGDVSVFGNVLAGGALTLSSGNTRSINIDTGFSISGTAVTLNTPTLFNDGTITATTGNLAVQSNAPGNALTLLLTSGSSMDAISAGGNVTFNATNFGAVSAASGFGDISAGNQVHFNGGPTPVNVSVNSISGDLTASGSPLFVTVFTGDLDLGPITTPGALNFDAINGKITVGGNINAGGALTLSSNPTKSITVNNGISAQGSTVTLNTPTLNNNGSITASTGILSVQSNAPGQALTLNFGNGSTMNAIGAGGSVRFNNTTAGSISAVSGFGNLAAFNQVSFNGGLNAVAVSVNSIFGDLAATGNPLSVAVATGDLDLGPIASPGNLNFATTNGQITVVGNVNAGGALTLSSGSAQSITVNNGITASGTSVTLNTPTLNNNGTITATTGNLAVQSNAPGNFLNLNLGLGSTMNANGAGSNITFNATTAGSISAISGSGDLFAVNQVNFNGGLNPVNISVHSINADLVASGNPLSIAVATGDLDIGPIVSSGALNFTAFSGDINVVGNVNTAGAALTLSSGPTGAITVDAGVTASGASVTLNTPMLFNDGTITATTGNLTVQSNAPGQTLDVDFSAGSAMNANGAGGNIGFNTTTAGSISAILGAGDLSATNQVNFNGGTNAVNVSVNSIVGDLAANGSPLSVSVVTGDLDIGPISSLGALNFATANGALTVVGNVNAGGALTLSSSPTKSITVNNGITASGTSVMLNTPTLNNNGTITATSGNVAVQSNAAGQTLALNLGLGSIVNANSLGASITFNATTAGSISAISGTGNLSANNQVNFNGGANAVNVSVNSIVGDLAATGSPLSVTVATGDLDLGPIATPGNLTLGTANGNVTLVGNITTSGALTLSSGNTRSITVNSGIIASGTTVNLNTPTLINNGTITATTGNLAVQSNAPGNALTLNLGLGSLMNANGAGSSVTFNATTAGSISAISGTGDLSATNQVNFNGGPNSVNVSVHSITGALAATGSPLSVAIASGDLDIGPITSPGALNFATANGDVTVVGNVTAGGALTLTSGTTKSITVNNGITATGTSVTLNTPILTNNGTITATTGNLAVQSNAPGSALTLNLGSGSTMNANSAGANITFNTTLAGSISASSGFGDLSAGNQVNFNGGANAVNVSVNSIIGALAATGNPLSIAVATGDLSLGPMASPGALNFATATGQITIVGNVNAGGTLTLSSSPTKSITINNSITASGTAVTLNTATLNNNGTITATTGNLAVQSNAPGNALILNLGSGSVMNANNTGSSITFNATTPGSISAGSGFGNLSANNQVSFNGGPNTVTVSINSVVGASTRVIGSGNSVSITTAVGSLNVGAMTASTSLTLQAINGGIDANASLTTPILIATGTAGPVSISSTNATTLTANSSGAVNIVDTSNGTISLNSSSAGNGSTFTLSAASAISLDVSGNLAAGAGTIGTVSLTTAGSLGNSSGTITANTVNLTSTAAGVSLGQAVNGTGGPSTVNIIAASNINSAGIGGNITANNISINSTGGDIVLTAALNAANSISLTATPGGAGAVSTTSTLTTPSLTLSAGTGGISIGAGGSTSASNFTANSTGNVTIVGTQAISGNGVSTGANFSLTSTAGAAAAITLNNTITATGTLGLFATGANSGMVINANVSGTTDTLTATGSGSITGTGIITGTTSVALTSGSGNIGPLILTTPNVTANTTGNVILVDTQAITGNGVSTGANFSLTDSANSAAAITLNNTITATGTLGLFATGVNSGIVINANVSGTVDTFSANGSGALTGTGTITGTTSVTMTSGSGAINWSLSTPNLTANTTGNVTLVDIQALTGNGVSTGANFSLNNSANAATAINLNNTITATGTLGLFATGATGGMSINANVSGTIDTFAATGTGTITGTGIISGTTSVALSSGSGAIGAITLATPSIQANTTGSIILTDTNTAISLGASSGSSFSLNASTVGSGITASGTLSSTTVNLNAGSAGINFTGANALNATTLTANSTGAVSIVDVAASPITLNPSSGSSFTLSATNGNLIAGSVTTTSGDITLTATTQDVTVNPGANITAFQDVNISGATGVTISNGAGMTAGTMAGANSPISTNMSDYDISGFASTGAVNLTSSGGSVNINSANLSSRGDNINVTSTTAITTGGSTFFAQGGNVALNAGTNLSGGGSLTAVARYIPGTVTVNGQLIQDFTGGGVAVFAGTPALVPNVILRNDALNRTIPGHYVSSGAVTLPGTTITYLPNNGWIDLITKGPGSINIAGSSLVADGGVIVFDPPTNINVAAFNVMAVGPSLVAPPPPPPPAPAPAPAPAVVVAPAPVAAPPPPDIVAIPAGAAAPSASTIIALDTSTLSTSVPTVLPQAPPNQPQPIVIAAFDPAPAPAPAPDADAPIAGGAAPVAGAAAPAPDADAPVAGAAAPAPDADAPVAGAAAPAADADAPVAGAAAPAADADAPVADADGPAPDGDGPAPDGKAVAAKGTTNDASDDSPSEKPSGGKHQASADVSDDSVSDSNRSRVQFVAVGPCQQYLLQDKDAYGNLCISIVAAAGTTLMAPEQADTTSQAGQPNDTADRTLVLKEGKMIVVSGQKHGLRVKVTNGMVTLPSQSVGIIEQKPSGLTRITMLSGQNATFQVSGTSQAMSAAAGEELLLGGSAADDDELIAADGVERHVISATLMKGSRDVGNVHGTRTATNTRVKFNLKAEKRSFSQQKMYEKEKLFICVQCSSAGCTKPQCSRTRKELHDKLNAKSEPASSNSKKIGSEPTPSNLRPVSAISTVHSLYETRGIPVKTFKTSSMVMKQTAAANVSFDGPDAIQLKNGEILLAVSHPITVKANGATITVNSDTIVSIVATPQAVAVRNVCDVKGNSIKVVAGSRSMSVSVGQEVIVGSRDFVPVQAIKMGGIGRRWVNNFEVTKKDNLMISDISLSSLISASPLLRQLKTGTDNGDKDMATKIMKMAVIVSMVTARRGPYAFNSPR